MSDASSDFGLAIDHSLCQGHGLCFGNLPEFFEEGEDGRGQVKHSTISGARRPELERIASLCPELAIKLYDNPADVPSDL